MKHYIDKDALVAEIERLIVFYSKEIENNKEDPWAMDIAKRDILQEMLSFLGTLEVTEENCEKMFGKKHKEFKPFEKVLTLHSGVWCADFYSYYNDSMKCHETMGDYIPDNEIVSYEGHESWVGKTTEECHE